MKRRVSCQIASLPSTLPGSCSACAIFNRKQRKLISSTTSRVPYRPFLVCGDFNCRLDSGSRGEDLVEAMFTCGLTCVSDRQTMTYIAPQGSSCIDLVFVSRHHSQLVDVSVAGSLEKKHQHVSIIFKIVPDIANHRSKAIRRINPDVLQCSFVPS